MIKVNLLPVRAARKKETFMNQIYVGILVIIISLGVVGWRAYSMQGKIKSLEREITKKQQDLEKLKDIEAEVEEFKAKNKVLADKVSVITSLEEGRDWFIQVIDYISQKMPAELWITSLTMGAKSSSRRGGGSSINEKPVQIIGGAYKKDDIGYFISNLESEKKYISSVNLGKITQKSSGKGTKAAFYVYDLTLIIKPPPTTEIK